MSDARILCRQVSVMVLLIFFSSGALFAKKERPDPAYLDEAFSSAEVSEISVLPAVDLRRDLSIKLTKLDEKGRGAAEKLLTKRRYKYLLRTDYGGVTAITEDDLEFMDPEWVGQLGGDEDRWVLLLVLEDLVTKKGQSAFTARCSGYLFDRSAAKAMWRHVTTESLGAPGLGALMVKKGVRGSTVANCFERLLVTLPDK